MPLFSRKKNFVGFAAFFWVAKWGNFAPPKKKKKKKKKQTNISFLKGKICWFGPGGAGCLWPLDEICESSPKFVMQEQSAWTEEKVTQTTETWTETKIDKHDRNTDRKEAWTERPKHGQKRSMDRKKWQTRPKHGHNRSTDRKSEKTRPKTWTEKAGKVRTPQKHGQKTWQIRQKYGQKT